VQNFTFEPKELTVRAGTTVTWSDAGGRHTVESADGFLKSDTLIAGQTYQKRFDTPGVYDYYCGNHGTKAGTGMTGRVVVTAR
jgi:plastocyanin